MSHKCLVHVKLPSGSRALYLVEQHTPRDRWAAEGIQVAYEQGGTWFHAESRKQVANPELIAISPLVRS